MNRSQCPQTRALPLRLVVLENRALPSTGMNVSLNSGILRVSNWLPSDTVLVRQMGESVTLEAAGDQQVYVGVRQVFLDVQYNTRVTNDTSGLGGSSPRYVYLARRDPTGRVFFETGSLAPGATSGPPAPPVLDWFDVAFSDPSFRSLTRSLAADGTIDRTDVFQLFAQVERDGTVSVAEYRDLGNLLYPERVTGAGAAGYTMPEPVRSLALKVVDGDPANRMFQGTPLGDLQAGSTADHLNKLVSKWFLGADRPLIRSNETYRFVSGALFVNGPSYTDVRQGNIGDCYFVAVLAEVAQGSPQRIVDMFTDNGDGTFTVRFYRDGTPQYVTVDRYLPTDAHGRPVYASFGTNYTNTGNELWVGLAEKAYAQINESGWLGRAAANSYAALASGYSDVVMRQVLGGAAGWTSIFWATRDQLIAAATSGRPTVLASLAVAPGNGVTASHGYGVVGYNATTGKFALYNPWGSHLELTWDQIRASFYGFWQVQG